MKPFTTKHEQINSFHEKVKTSVKCKKYKANNWLVLSILQDKSKYVI